MSGIIGKKVGMTSIFDADREKHSLYGNRSWTLCSNTGKDRREQTVTFQFSWVSSEAKEKNTTHAFERPLCESKHYSKT